MLKTSEGLRVLTSRSPQMPKKVLALRNLLQPKQGSRPVNPNTEEFSPALKKRKKKKKGRQKILTDGQSLKGLPALINRPRYQSLMFGMQEPKP